MTIPFQAFRNNDRKDKIGQRLTDIQLAVLLKKFIEKHPQLNGVLNTGEALRSMSIDSRIANLVIDHFTQQGIPVLCNYDSFIMQYDKEPELRRILDQDTHQITSSRISYDIKNEQNSDNVIVSGNIKSYRKPVSIEFNTPTRIKPIRQYELRREKFHKWLDLVGGNGT